MQQTLERLTKRHTVTIHRDPPLADTIATADALIAQLREAIFGEDGRNGGQSESRSRLPLSAPALDLYETIDAWITELWVQKFQRVPGAEHPEVLLAEWAEGVEPERTVIYSKKRLTPTTKGARVETEMVTSTARELLEHIETLIIDLLERPTVLVPVKGACPAVGCFATTITRWVDGERTETPTLAFVREQATGETISVHCQSCEHTWPREEFKSFALALAQTERGIKPHQIDDLRAMV